MDLVVDLGQSGSRVSVAGKVMTLSIAKNATEPVIDTVERILKEIPQGTYDTVYLSLTGLFGEVKDEKPFGQLCARLFNSSNVCVMDDGIAALVGALGTRSGVALAIGGGIVAVSSHAGRLGHADGKGAIFGDFGSGFWIGQKALSQAIATIDGRDNAQDLVELLQAELDQYSRLANATGTEAATLCINAARTVAVGAESGVVGAQHIITDAAHYVARTVVAAWSKVSSHDATVPAVALLGGLAKSPFYARAIHDRVSALLACEFVQPRGDHLSGAPLAGQMFAQGAPPLLKWWRA